MYFAATDDILADIASDLELDVKEASGILDQLLSAEEEEIEDLEAGELEATACS